LSPGPVVTERPGQFGYSRATLKALLTRAFTLRDEQVVGPAWIGTDSFDIVAKVPTDATKEQVNQMIQRLLVERFGLGYHMEIRELPVYEMVVAKGGLKMKEVSSAEGAPALSATQPNTPPPQAGGGSGPLSLVPDKNGGQELAPGVPGMVLMRPKATGERRVTARMQPVSKLLPLIQRSLGRAVVDKTGLTGTYDFNLDFADTPPSGQAGSAEPTADAGPPLAAALESQLGLRLESRKDPLDVLVVDKVNRTPTEN
jgi:uncharacterized protein (TIGR03435 family)